MQISSHHLQGEMVNALHVVWNSNIVEYQGSGVVD